ncbi:MAG TPA: sulfatase [Actinomycetota bacterium]|nr:sulfatase [Actinomycetota bacterium]
MSRLARLVGIAAITVASLPMGPQPAPAASGRPNVLIILTDDQRPDTLEVMPETRRWFEAGGTSFRNAFATTPLCCPSRASIYTGRYAHNHGVRTNKHAHRLDERKAIQRYLGQNGYLTAITGKYLNSWEIRRDPRGFDRWALSRGGYRGFRTNVDGVLGRSRAYQTKWVQRTAVRFLRWFERRDARPWMLFVNTLAPHGSFDPAKQYANAAVPPRVAGPAAFEVDRSDKPPWVQRNTGPMRPVSEVRTKQLRTLMSVDDLVDRLMIELGELNERRRTLAVFLSDNGYFWGEHMLNDKRLPYTEAVAIPFLLRWPGHVAPGRVDTRLVANVDLAPTVLQAAGIPRSKLRERLDGRSVLGTHVRDRMLLEYWTDRTGARYPDWASIRTRRFQYAEYYAKDGTRIFREYYDLLTDPWQLENLLGDASAVNDPPRGELAELSSDLASLRACRGTGGRAACP